jgi:hypothetical protein
VTPKPSQAPTHAPTKPPSFAPTTKSDWDDDHGSDDFGTHSDFGTLAPTTAQELLLPIPPQKHRKQFNATEAKQAKPVGLQISISHQTALTQNATEVEKPDKGHLLGQAMWASERTMIAYDCLG